MSDPAQAVIIHYGSISQEYKDGCYRTKEKFRKSVRQLESVELLRYFQQHIFAAGVLEGEQAPNWRRFTPRAEFMIAYHFEMAGICFEELRKRIVLGKLEWRE